MNTTLKDFNNSNSYSLSIRFSSDGFSLYAYDENSTLLSFKSIPVELFSKSKEEIIEVLSKEEELSLNFRNVRLILETELYSIVPTAIYSPENELYLLKLQHSNINISDKILVNELTAWDAVLLFSIPTQLYTVLAEILPEINIENHILAFINDYVELENDRNVNVWIRQNYIDIVVLEKWNLIFINSFEFKSDEDFIYLILKIYEKLELSSELCKLKIHNVKSRKTLTELASKYIRNCSSTEN